jgi:DNA-binding NarL/FixJ family response regulator
MQRAKKPNSGGVVRAIIIDDSQLFRLGLRIYLAEAMPELEVVGEAASGDDGVALAETEKPDLVMLDASLRDCETAEVLSALRGAVPEADLVLLASVPSHDDMTLALTSHVEGYLLKAIEPRELVTGLREVVRGVPWRQPELTLPRCEQARRTVDASRPLPERTELLTPRQLDVLLLVARGLRNTEIARQLHISEETVKTHVAHLLRKLGVRSRVQAAAYAVHRRLVQM